jgi:hypothetical protein
MVVADESRIQRRIHLRARVSLDGADRYFLGLSENISLGGVFIESWCPPVVGQPVTLIVGPDERPLRVGGIVRWHRVDEVGEVNGCGVQFDRLDEHQTIVLMNLLRLAPHDPMLVSLSGDTTDVLPDDLVTDTLPPLDD